MLERCPRHLQGLRLATVMFFHKHASLTTPKAQQMYWSAECPGFSHLSARMFQVLKYPTLIKGFRLHFGSATHYPNGSPSEFEIIASPYERSHVLTDLQPWSNYNVSLQPFNKQLLGRKSPFKVVFMPQIPPSAPPTQVNNSPIQKSVIIAGQVATFVRFCSCCVSF